MTPRAAAMTPERRRQAIVDVVLPLLLTNGGEVSTREIAQAAGIAEGTIFRVFPDKASILLAAAEHTFDPTRELEELHAATEGCDSLRLTIERAADHLLRRSQHVMPLLMALRHVWLSSGAGDRPPQAPTFMVDANQALMSGLTALFEPYSDQLGVKPRMAATVLRTLALGSRHPGAHTEDPLTPHQVADVMLDGIVRRSPA